MFSKLKNKIKFGIILFLVIVIILENIIIFFSIKNVVKNKFDKTTEEAVSLSYNNVNSFFSLIFNLVDLKADDEDFYLDIINNDYSLNSLKIPSLNIIGVIFYELDHNIHYSDGMGGIVPLENFYESSTIKNFFDNNNLLSYLSIRKNNINDFYVTNNPYDDTYGIISYIKKIYYNNNLVGYLFVDINPVSLYNKFFSYKQYNNMENTITLLKTDDATYLGDNELIINKEDNYLKFENSNELIIKTYVPVSNYTKYFLSMYFPIFLFSCIILILSIAFAFTYSNKIVYKLDELNNKMNNSDELINNIIEIKPSVK